MPQIWHCEFGKKNYIHTESVEPSRETENVDTAILGEDYNWLY